MVKYDLQNRNPAHSSSNQSHGSLLPALQPSFCAPMRPARRLEVYAVFCCILCSRSSFFVTKKRLGSSILQIFMANAAPKLTRAVRTTCRTKKRQGQGAPKLQTNLATLQRETCPILSLHVFFCLGVRRFCPDVPTCFSWRKEVVHPFPDLCSHAWHGEANLLLTVLNTQAGRMEAYHLVKSQKVHT